MNEANKYMTETVQQQLRRLTELQAMIHYLGDNTPEEVFTEYRGLAEPLVQEYLPLVQWLARAGLLTLNVREEALAEVIKGGYIAAAFDCRDAWDNGSIWLEGHDPCMLTPKQPKPQIADGQHRNN